MLRGAKLALGVLILLGVLAAAPAEETAEAVKSNTAFALDLYRELSKKPGNILFSPFSLSLVLGMTQAGARGATAEEMVRVLHFLRPADKIHSAFGALVSDLKERGNQPGCELILAYRLWLQKGYVVEPAFLALMEKHYGVTPETADFRGKPEEARQAINAWSQQQTAGRISELLPGGSITAEDRLILASAAVLKAAWRSPFAPEDTGEGSFFPAPGREIKTLMMEQEAAFPYGTGPGFSLVELPYAGGELAMVILLPDKVNGLADLERKLSPARLEAWLSGMSRTEVEVCLPRWIYSDELDLGPILSALGMKQAFSGKADFSAMAAPMDEPPLSLSRVAQKVYIEVTEAGTEAGAVSDVSIKMMNGGKSFRADHPFLYLIRDRKTGTILFLGRLVEPPGEELPARE